ncbi:hypothetical protein OQ496_14155 [Acetobacter suratthaniensis]|uniref:ATP-grasp domain-containing protein n=1 Tax=Acetobacter suratthaniensis TaxID=1502841 RepID=A0ABS3LQC2_9PROT|nr:hypothetical protein [Acetobacter suratthaniensis]MBO1329555.1 hypothetical protein [Acetobacter suratthaniensis]MCX2567585.1 hypothetical protein [Acetobacter suratthaniensis]
MAKYVVAGASSIEDIQCFLDVTRQAGMAILLVENAAMWQRIPACHRKWVICSDEIPCTKIPMIPLNEFWVTRAIQSGTTNISLHALRASRSKHYLSERLSQCGVHALPRCYIEDVCAPGPERYLARLDAGYSGYGIVRHVEVGRFDPQVIRRAVQDDASATMRAVLGEDDTRVVVEDWLEGEEYSADVFVNHGQVEVLRLFRKIIVWINGKPVCDSYVAVASDATLCAAIYDWCAALFSVRCISFGQFDFIVSAGQAVVVDFSCRIGGGLNAIKQFAGIPSYVGMALVGCMPYFAPFTVQKNLVARRSGRLTNIEWSVSGNCQIIGRKQIGDLLSGNISSSSARVAEICFIADDMKEAIAVASELENMVKIDVHE